jgi:hypothetical protein
MPAEYARDELMPSLKNGRQVILSEMGHVNDVWSVQPSFVPINAAARRTLNNGN